MSRKLSASERINHTLLAINYGAILVLLLPILIDWAGQPVGIKQAYQGWLSIAAAASAVGVGLFGLRDFAASKRLARLSRAPAAELVAKLGGRQTVLVTGATGFIGSRLVAALTGAGHEVIALVRNPAKTEMLLPLTESAKSHACFTHELCEAWEKAAVAAQTHGVRVVCLRIGLVLGIDGGLVTRMLTPFEFGLGGPLGSGRQWMSWIERDDLVRLIAHVMAKSDISGPINATAAIPVTNLKFTEELAYRLHRPAVFRVPDALLRRIGGDFANELLLGGQRVIPIKALGNGFVFRHETLRSAFEAILSIKSRFNLMGT